MGTVSTSTRKAGICKNSSIDQLLQILPSLPVITVETATSVLDRHMTNVNGAVNENLEL